MMETCHVLFPSAHRCTVRSIIFCLDSLLTQLQKQDANAAVEEITLIRKKEKDLNAATEKIVVANDLQLQLKVSQKSTGIHYNGLPEAKQEGKLATCLLPENSSVTFVIQQIKGLIRQLYPWLLQRGWYTIKSITFQDGVLTFMRSESIMTHEKLRKVMFPGHPSSRLMLLDASSMLCEGYYATAKKGIEVQRNAMGFYTNGVYAMTRKLLWLLRDYHPTHLAMCWDVSRDSLLRRRLYPEYKGLRSEKPASLKEQYQTAQFLFERMGITQLKVEGYEADDLVGTLADRWTEEVGDPCYIVSADHDLYQLLNENVSILQHKREQGKTLYTQMDFVREYGIEPRQWIDVKALLGESGMTSDNIPGVKGVGEEGALLLIQQYGSIEELYNRIHELEGTKLKRYIKPLLQDSELANLSKQLVRITTDVPDLQHIEMDDLRIRIDKAAMINEFKTLGFHTILSEIKEGRYRAS